MKFYKDEAGIWSLNFDKKGEWFIHGINEWAQFIGGWNWIMFHPIQIELMRDFELPGIELEVIVMGLGFRFRGNFDWSKTKTGRHLKKVDKEIKSGKVKGITLDEFKKELKI